MKIQLNTDNHVDGTEALEARVNAMIEQYLGRFSSRLSRIEVFLSDHNSVKGGPNDRRCALEARLENDDPVGASHDAEDTEKAIRGACDKLKVMLDARIEKQRGY
ncbi:HPF/RaiA family ribosome-associated protein [Luteimonas terrae]|uniref:Ribosome-associated translation inhibitor RaiA n=1 Tax=Luteimonas terrae TaxID=1530191 RepID=A0ABU1Y199_9GAMM|nr:HPF/RaiA family ribosome-associated protein [Luteimonas terrae]MDR7194608.1 ribosome-associated translation inhibitor RaiA [Luteimonas terrae]